jgi:hypothetical protein
MVGDLKKAGVEVHLCGERVRRHQLGEEVVVGEFLLPDTVRTQDGGTRARRSGRVARRPTARRERGTDADRCSALPNWQKSSSSATPELWNE